MYRSFDFFSLFLFYWPHNGEQKLLLYHPPKFVKDLPDLSRTKTKSPNTPGTPISFSMHKNSYIAHILFLFKAIPLSYKALPEVLICKNHCTVRLLKTWSPRIPAHRLLYRPSPPTQQIELQRTSICRITVLKICCHFSTPYFNIILLFSPLAGLNSIVWINSLLMAERPSTTHFPPFEKHFLPTFLSQQGLYHCVASVHLS